MNNGLPQSWATASLSDIADINPRHPRDLDDELPVSFAPMSVLSESRPEFNGLRERPLREVRKGFTHFAEGDVLFAKITPCMENGKAAVATRLRNGLGCGTTELHVLRPLAGIDPLYIYHLIHQPSFRRDAEANFTGTAGQLRVPVAFIENAEIPLAPLSEQRRIVAKLEKLLGKVDICQQRLAKIPILLKRFHQSVLAAACSGRLTANWRERNPKVQSASAVIERMRAEHEGVKIRRGVPECVPGSDLISEWELPETWGAYSAADLLRVGAFADLKDGNHGANHPKVSEFTETGRPFITAAQVNNFRIDYDGAYKISGKPLERIRVGFAKAGDVIYTHKGSVGRTAVADRDCVLTPQTTYYRVSEELFVPGFLMLYLASQPFSEQVDVVKEQTTRDFVPISEQYLLFHRVPPLTEQQEIVRRVEALFALADQIGARYAKAKAHVEKLTQSILAKAFRGELVPQDPNDEPASALLERIKKNKSKSDHARKRLALRPS